MIKLLNEDYYYTEPYYNENSITIKISWIEVNITTRDNETGEVYKTYVEINNNDRMKPTKFVEFVEDQYMEEIRVCCEKDNETLLSVDDFVVHALVNDSYWEEYYFDKVDDIYDFIG